ncbi:hypothetical protein NC651_038561 [Populus alba x Populus x berolinensis]|nr:hypothetical protein NC651_038561 [Populus alba x Populus x berolinensis]
MKGLDFINSLQVIVHKNNIDVKKQDGFGWFMHKICIESIYKAEIFIKGNIICFLIENGQWWSVFSLVKTSFILLLWC